MIRLLLIFIPMILLLLPGCGEIIRWGKAEIPAIKKIPFDDAAIKPYMHTLYLYDEFMLALSVDALYLAEFIRAKSVELYAERNGIPDKQKQSMLSQQKDEYKQVIGFYILLPYTMDLLHTSTWSIRLHIDDITYPTYKIKRLELSPEYRRFFGSRYSRFKDAYKVEFIAVDSGKRILSPDQPFILQFNNGTFHGEINFHPERAA